MKAVHMRLVALTLIPSVEEVGSVGRIRITVEHQSNG